jgi:TalC/MipB family fructose-6-phosphate aldolase
VYTHGRERAAGQGSQRSNIVFGQRNRTGAQPLRQSRDEWVRSRIQEQDVQRAVQLDYLRQQVRLEHDMALYIDCALLNDITNVARTVPLAGVTTNPSILLAARERGQNLPPRQLLSELLRVQSGTVFIQPGATDDAGMYAEALEYIQADPERVIPKIPVIESGLRVARRLKEGGQRLAFTAVVTLSQTYIAAMLQAEFVIPYYNRMTRAGIDAGTRISEMADILSNSKAPTRILVASLKSTQEAEQALLAGADDLTLTPQVLLDMVTDPLSQQAVEKFSGDWQKMQKL